MVFLFYEIEGEQSQTNNDKNKVIISMLTLLHLLSSVALLVWGTHIIRTGIMRVFGSDLRRILGKSINKNPTLSAGVGVTALVQSSNATALLVISL